MSDPFALALGAAVSAATGAFAHRLLLDRERDRSSVCPTCYGPLGDDGLSESWSVRMVRDDYAEDLQRWNEWLEQQEEEDR